MKIVTALLIVFALACPAAHAGTVNKVFYGVPQLKYESGEASWFVTAAGRPFFTIGTAAETAKNKKLLACLEENQKNGWIAKFEGVFLPEDNALTLEGGSLSCQTIVKAKDCPKAVIRQETVRAIYHEVVCGDFCHMIFTPETGFADSVYADEEEAEKLFGKAAGKPVSITYDVESAWMPDSPEFDPIEPGACVYQEVFKSGRVLKGK